MKSIHLRLRGVRRNRLTHPFMRALPSRSRALRYRPLLFMRAPGEASGSIALESATDEWRKPAAWILWRSDSKTMPRSSPFPVSSFLHLRECYRQGAERFGWERRPKVDPGFGQMRMKASAPLRPGASINLRLVKSQHYGGMICGVSFALHEQSIMGPRSGGGVNSNLAEYPRSGER